MQPMMAPGPVEYKRKYTLWVLVVLILFGRWLEARARHRSGQVLRRLAEQRGQPARRLGEAALAAIVPRDHQTEFANAMILHGRETCIARKPNCAECALYVACDWPDKPPR